jgi:hypothetical protein
MTRRPASREAMFRAADAYRRRFGEAPPTRRFNNGRTKRS